ncbi:MAG: hypothetical protein D6706_13545 [Chloroflexi bacterium]|nr:MAG: hypothetical protein D6706_13545 [Chloroflexota bacterium]
MMKRFFPLATFVLIMILLLVQQQGVSAQTSYPEAIACYHFEQSGEDTCGNYDISAPPAYGYDPARGWFARGNNWWGVHNSVVNGLPRNWSFSAWLLFDAGANDTFDEFIAIGWNNWTQVATVQDNNGHALIIDQDVGPLYGWHHVAGVIDADNGVITAYLDGVHIGDKVFGGALGTLDNVTTPSVYSPALLGDERGMDDIVFWGGMLTPEQVAVLAQTTPPDGLRYESGDNGLIGNYNLSPASLMLPNGEYNAIANGGNAAYWDGQHAYAGDVADIQVAYTTLRVPDDVLTDTFSLSIWISPTVMEHDGGIVALLGNGDIRIDNAQNNNPDITTIGIGRSWGIVGGVSISTGGWHNITYVQTGITGTLWVDGAAVYTDTQMSTLSGPYMLFFHDGGPYSFRSYNGWAHDIRLWNRPLSDEEVAWWYAHPNGTPPVASCPGYSLSQHVVTGIVYADTDNGGPDADHPGLIPPPGVTLEAGNLYAIEVSQPWQDNGVDSYAMDWKLPNASIWHPVDETFPGVRCIEQLTDGGARIYMYWTSDIQVRAHDTDGDWSNNSGTLIYDLYGAQHTDTSGSCAAKYTVADFYVSDFIPAYDSDGDTVPPPSFTGLVDGEAYKLEWAGTYWSDNGYPNTFVEISLDGGQTWTLMTDTPGVCYAPDPGSANGWALYFVAQSGWDMRIRVHDIDGDWTNNTGSVFYNLYLSTYHGSSGSCPYERGQFLETAALDANDTYGVVLPTDGVFLPGQVYAIEGQSGNWIDQDGTTHYDYALSTDGTLWYAADQHPAILCSEVVTGTQYTRAFFRAPENGSVEHLIARVNADAWGANSGGMGIALYGADIAPGAVSCDDNYIGILDRIDAGVVPITPTLHDDVVGVLAGYTYRLETIGDAFVNFPNDTEHATIEVSTDGVSFVPLADFADCIVTLTDGSQRAYFTAQTNGLYIRIHDPDMMVNNNAYRNGIPMRWELYGTSRTDGNGGEFPPTPPQTWEETSICATVCTRPEHTVVTALNIPVPDVGGWLEYGRCRLQKFVAVCPYHLNAFDNATSALAQREPFHMIGQFRDVLDNIQAQINAYDWGPAEAGGYGQREPSDWLPSLTPDNPLMGGQIDLMPDTYESYNAMCQSSLVDVVGDRLSSGMCFGFDIADKIGLVPGYQLIVNLSMLGVLGAYIYARINALDR